MLDVSSIAGKAEEPDFMAERSLSGFSVPVFIQYGDDLLFLDHGEVEVSLPSVQEFFTRLRQYVSKKRIKVWATLLKYFETGDREHLFRLLDYTETRGPEFSNTLQEYVDRRDGEGGGDLPTYIDVSESQKLSDAQGEQGGNPISQTFSESHPTRDGISLSQIRNDIIRVIRWAGNPISQIFSVIHPTRDGISLSQIRSDIIRVIRSPWRHIPKTLVDTGIQSISWVEVSSLKRLSSLEQFLRALTLYSGKWLVAKLRFLKNTLLRMSTCGGCLRTSVH